MLSTIAKTIYETPKYALGDEVVCTNNYSLPGITTSERGIIIGYIWNHQGELTHYHFAPHSEKSRNYPDQPIRPQYLS